jgi:cytochrome c biogenesis protein
VSTGDREVGADAHADERAAGSEGVMPAGPEDHVEMDPAGPATGPEEVTGETVPRETAAPARADVEGTTPPDSEAPPQANPRLRKPRPTPASDPVGFAWESIRMGWRWLTRMRTALYLLGLLGLMTMLATVAPQEPNVPTTVQDWRTGEEGPGETVAALIDLVGGYDVYGSPAFLALLLLLFLSLTACLIPRIRSWVRLVRRSQPPRSRHLDRQPVVSRFTTDAPPERVHEVTRAQLGRRHRWRLRQPDGPDAPGRPQVAAEKGLWSREGGSLLFHLSFYVLVLAVVFGQLASFEGQVGVVEGEGLGFADTEVSYWTYRPGRWWDEDSHAGWALDLEEFHVDWVRDLSQPGAGQPTTFASDVVVEHADGRVTETTVEGNRPASFDGMRVHQLDWGYAPQIVVEQDGEVVHDAYLTATVTDTGFFRAAVKAPAAEPDIGLEIFFYPYAPMTDEGVPALTGAPWPDDPLIIVREYRGDLQLGATQQTINELDTTLMESVGGAFLRPGDEVELSDGSTVAFPDLRRWVGFQVSQRPQLPWLILASVLLVGGLIPALYAYRRRLWIAAERDEATGRTLVTVAGRAFQRPQTFEDEHEKVVHALAEELGADPAGPSEPDATSSTNDPAPDGADPEVVPR